MEKKSERESSKSVRSSFMVVESGKRSVDEISERQNKGLFDQSGR